VSSKHYLRTKRSRSARVCDAPALNSFGRFRSQNSNSFCVAQALLPVRCSTILRVQGPSRTEVKEPCSRTVWSASDQFRKKNEGTRRSRLSSGLKRSDWNCLMRSSPACAAKPLPMGLCEPEQRKMQSSGLERGDRNCLMRSSPARAARPMPMGLHEPEQRKMQSSGLERSDIKQRRGPLSRPPVLFG